MKLPSPPRRREILWISLAITVISLVYYGAYFRDYKIDVDEGLLINGTVRVLSGQLPLRDFHQYMPGPYYSMAVWFLLFGPSILVERLFFLVLLVVKNILMYRLSRRLLPLPLALLPCALMLAWPGFWIKNCIGFILLAALLLLWRYLDKPTTRSLVMLGLAIGASVYFREDMAGYSALTAGLIIVLSNAKRKAPFRRIVVEGLVLGLAITAALAPLFILYASEHALPDLVRGIGETVRLGQVESLDTTRVDAGMPWPPRLVKGYLYYLTPLFLLVFGLILARRLAKRSPDPDGLNLKLTATVVLAALSFYHIWHWHNEYRFPQTGILLHVLWAFVIWRAWRMVRSARRGAGAAVLGKAAFGVLAILLVLGVQIYFVAVSTVGHYMWVYDGASIVLRNGPHQAIEGAPRSRITPPIEQAVVLSGLIDFIKRETGPRDRIFAFGESILYFLTDRKNATEFDNGRIPAYFPRQREKWVAQMKAVRPKVVILRKWEYTWWYPKMPEAFEAVLPGYLWDREIGDYYVLTRTESPDPAVREGTTLLWKGDLAGAASAYGRALRSDPLHFRIRKNLNRLFFDRGLWERAAVVLEGFAVNRTTAAWELRWGTRDRRSFSGTLVVEGADDLSRLLDIEASSSRGGPVKWSVSGSTIHFESELGDAASGLTLFFHQGHPPLKIRMGLRLDGRPITEIFDFEAGWREAASLEGSVR